MYERFAQRIGVKELLALLGDVFVFASIFVPWIYAFSAPSGPDLKVTQVAAPDLIDLVLRSNYEFLLLVPLGLVLGILFVVVSRGRGRGGRVVLIATSFVFSFLGMFAFGSQFGSSVGLLMDGQYVSYSLALGPGSRVMQIGVAMYFLSLIGALWSED